MGVARVLRAERPTTAIIVAEPENTPILASGIAQSYNDDSTPAESHPTFRAHPVQGWGPDFIPRLTGDALEGGLVDAIQPISGADAIRLARELALREGIFCGGDTTLVACNCLPKWLASRPAA
jgi:cysteine synthase A